MASPAASSPGAATRARLIRAAIEIAAREGLSAATTAAIAQEAGVAEGTLYRHFSTKDALLIAAYRQIKTQVFKEAARQADERETAPERLKHLWKSIYLAYRSDRDAFLFGQRFMESALAEVEGGEAAREIAALVSRLRKDGLASGDFKKLSPDLMASLFLAPISYMLKSEIKGRRWTGAELEAAAEAVLASWRRP